MHVSIEDKQKATLGIYFHIPFCPHLCPYCDFVKTDRFSRSDVLSYWRWLDQELELVLQDPRVSCHETVTVYFGGGTPGLFWGSSFAPLLDRIRVQHRIEECTIESNPWMTSRAKFASWRDIGCNRVTLGAQSLDDGVLNFLGRPHRRRDVVRALEDSRAVGFDNVQVDIIYGLPEGTSSSGMAGTIDELASLGATGVSCYALSVEQRTRFGESGVVPSEESAVADYDEISASCFRNGFVRRETSNFSVHECKHNNVYWYGLPYVGIGAGAHGLMGPDSRGVYGERYRYGPPADSPTRVQEVPGRDHILGDGVLPSPWLERVSEGYRTVQDAVVELSYTLLRTPGGLPRSWLAMYQAAGIIASTDWKQDPVLSRGLVEGQLSSQDGDLRVTARGLLMGDYWHRQFLRSVGLFQA